MAKFEIVTKDFATSDGKHYYIIRTDTKMGKRYGVIGHDLLVNGELTRPVFGGEMMLSETVSELIQRAEWRVKVDRWVGQGYDREAAAIAAVQGIEIEKAQALWNEHKPAV